MRALSFFVLLVVAILASGCGFVKGEVTYAPMGTEAPAFGSGDFTKMESFIVGRWCACSITDAAFAKQLGVQDITEEEIDTKTVYVFKSDGTFQVTHSGFGWRADGTWKKESNGITLKYEKLDGFAWEEAKVKVQEKAESGRQTGLMTDVIYDDVFRTLPKLNSITLAPDQKRLAFQDTSPPPSFAEHFGGESDAGGEFVEAGSGGNQPPENTGPSLMGQGLMRMKEK